MLATESVFLFDAEPHHPVAATSAQQLRAAVALHLIFADRLVLGDSQALNSRAFRELVIPSASEEPVADIASLLNQGELVVARREGSTLKELAEIHRGRNVDSSATDDYISTLEELTQDASADWTWSLTEAEDTFRTQVIERLRDPLPNGVDPSKVIETLNWIEDRQTLNYSELRALVEGWDHRDTARFVDELAGSQYRLTLPELLQTAIADSTQKGSPLRYLQWTEPDPSEGVEVTSWVLQPKALALIPMDAIREARALSATRAIEDALLAQRVEGHANMKALDHGLRELVNRLELAAIDASAGKTADALSRLRHKPAKVRMAALRGTVIGAASGLAVHAVGGDLPTWTSGGIDLLLLSAGITAALAYDRNKQVEQQRSALETRLLDHSRTRPDQAGFLARAVAPLL